MTQANPSDPSNPADPKAEPPPKPKKKLLRRLLYIAGGLIVFLLLLVLLAPTLLSTAPARVFALGKVNENLNGKLDIGDWSFGWTNGVTLNNVKVEDDQGRRVAEVGSIRVPASLLSLARGNYDLGEIVIDKPSVDVELYPDGTTNLQHLAKQTKGETKEPREPAEPKEPKGQESSKLPDVHAKITINDLQATVSGEQIGAPIKIDPSTISINIPSINSPIENNVQIAYRVGNSPASTISVSGTVDAIQNNELDLDNLTADQKIELHNVDFAVAGPMLKKSDPKANVGGIANGTLAIKADGLNKASVDGQLNVANLAYTGAALKGDTYKTSKIAIPINITTAKAGDDTQIKIQTLKVQTDQVVVDVSGQVTQQALQNLAANKAPGADGQIAVAFTTIDLPGLIKSLPNTLAIQKDVQIDAAKVAARVDVLLAKDRASVKQTLDVDAAGKRGAQAIKLDPVHLDTAVTAIPTGGPIPDVRDLVINLTSAFASAQGGAKSISNIDIKGNVDLAKAYDQAAQFVDMGALKFAGAGTFSIGSKGDLTKTGGSADASANLTLTNVIVHGLKDRGDLNEPRLVLDAAAKLVRGDKDFIQKVESAQVTVVSGDAQAPVVDVLVTATNVSPAGPSVEKFDVQKVSIPDLNRVQTQFAAFMPPTLKAQSGSILVRASGSYLNNTLTVDQKVEIRGVTLQSVQNGTAQNLISNENEDIAAIGTIAMPPNDAMVANFTTLSASSANKLFAIAKSGQGPLVVKIKNGAIAGNGEVSISSDLKRVLDVVQAMGAPKSATPTATTAAPQPGQLTSGQFDATLKLAATEKQTDITLDGGITNLGVTTSQAPIQNEKVTLAVRASTPATFDAVSVDSVVVDSSFAKTTVSKAQIKLAGGTFDKLQQASIQVAIPDIQRTMDVAQAFSPPAPATAPATTQPVEPLKIGGGAAVAMDITRDQDTTHIKISELGASKVSLVRGKRRYDFAKPIALKLNADLATAADQISKIKVSELGGDLGGLASLTMPTPIEVTNLAAKTPTAAGKIAITGDIQPLTQLLSAVQGADPMPYRGSYSVAQALANDSSNAIKLVGDVTIEKLVVLQADNKTPAFSEDKLALSNDLVADLDKKTATINSVALTMPSSQAAGVLIKGKVSDWEQARKLDGVTCDLSYDLAKLWPMVKPMLAPETQEQLKDLKTAGQFKKTFAIGGSFPATVKPGDKPIRYLTANGGLAVQLLDTSGINVQNLEIPLSLANGQLVTLYMDKPKAERAAKPAVFNGGTLDVNSIAVDLNGDEPRLTVGKNQKLVAGASINSLLGDTLGKYVNPVFANSKRAKGLLDVTMVECNQLALGDKLKTAESGNCKIVFSLSDMDIANPVGQLMLGPIVKAVPGFSGGVSGEADAFQGSIKDAVITVANGRTTQDITMNLIDSSTANAVGGSAKPVTMPLTFQGDINLADLKQLLKVSLPPQLIGKFIPDKNIKQDLVKIFPNGIPITMRGTTTKPQVDTGNMTKQIAEGLIKSKVTDVIPGLTGGKGGDKGGGLGGLLDQLGGKKSDADQPDSSPAPSKKKKK